MTLAETTTRTLEVPGVTLTYDVRAGTGRDIPLFLIGSPMGAAGFVSLASHFGVADELGAPVVVFPSHHGGFLGGEYGWPGEPEAFAAKLRDVLDQ